MRSLTWYTCCFRIVVHLNLWHRTILQTRTIRECKGMSKDFGTFYITKLLQHLDHTARLYHDVLFSVLFCTAMRANSFCIIPVTSAITRSMQCAISLICHSVAHQSIWLRIYTRSPTVHFISSVMQAYILRRILAILTRLIAKFMKLCKSSLTRNI